MAVVPWRHVRVHVGAAAGDAFLPRNPVHQPRLRTHQEPEDRSAEGVRLVYVVCDVHIVRGVLPGDSGEARVVDIYRTAPATIERI